jgi:AcrR family transcriptional regulator
VAETTTRWQRRKQRTREQIAQTALKLFAERGFDEVTVAEIADAADVVEKTVFNHFPSKDDLVFDEEDSFEAVLVQTVRERPAGQPVIAAFAAFLQSRFEWIDQPNATAGLETMARLIANSPILQARERKIFDRYASTLAHLIAADTQCADDDIPAQVAAHAMIGLHRALLAEARRRVLAGQSGPALRRAIRAEAIRGLEHLERGLGDYAPNPPLPTSR